jgi:dynein light chain 1
MSKFRDVIKEWEEREGQKITDAEVIKLYGILPPIEKIESGPLSQMKKCKYLSLSTNSIEKIPNLTGLSSLEILSLGRNQIKRIENMDGVADTLRQLWISYNQIEKLGGIEKLKKLQVLYMSNNKVEKWSEFERLKELPELEDLLFVGNPLERNTREKGENWRAEVMKRLPNLKRLDGKPTDDITEGAVDGQNESEENKQAQEQAQTQQE